MHNNSVARASHAEFIMQDLFRKFSVQCANTVGSSWSFLFALLVVIMWLVTGPYFHYSDTWQLLINTGTTIVTFLMVFLIQNAQNREAQCTQLKLDELIRALHGARNNMVNLENLSDTELKELQEEFKRIGHKTGQNSRIHT
jgi:low affinity Fe/Cu permease